MKLKSKKGTQRSLFFVTKIHVCTLIEEKICDLLDEKFREEGFQDCFLVDLKMSPSNKLEVYVDADSGLTLEKCHIISRHLEAFLDAEGILGEKYVLEVSSPGIDRPLKMQRQYQKNVGREVEVTLTDGSLETGKLEAVSEESVMLFQQEKVKEGKKNIRIEKTKQIPFESIKQTLVKVSFKN